MIDYKQLESQGKTVVYQETDTFEQPDEGWEYWSKRETPERTVFVWRRVMTFEEVEQHNLFN